MNINGKTVNLVLRGGRVIDPSQGMDGTADVLIVDGRIQAIEPHITLDEHSGAPLVELEVGNKWVVPGLVDMHVHLREPGEEYKETIATGTRAAVAGGFTAVACMPNTRPVNDNSSVTRFILEQTRETGVCRVFPVGAISQGLTGDRLAEFGELKSAGVVAVTDDGQPVASSQLMRKALEYAKAFGLLVISHAEDPDLSHGGLMNEGRVSTVLGLRGIPNAAEEVMVARDVLLAELTGSRVHIAHVSTRGSVRIIREAKSRGVAVTAETAPHYFTLTEEALVGFDTNCKMNPPLRTRDDVAAVKEGLADGTIDAIATDHAPHSVIEKDTEFELAANGIIGLESALPLVLALVREGLLSPTDAVAKMSCNPARILNIHCGSLHRERRIDLTIIDPDVHYELDCETFQSKARNCPFHGSAMQGRAWMTLVDGKIAFSRTNL